MRTGAAPHPASLTPPIRRVGGLVWWIFRNSDSEPELLIERAAEAGLPAIFLPLPHPVAPEVAFARGLERATATTPGDNRVWRADRVLGIRRLPPEEPGGEDKKRANEGTKPDAGESLAQLTKIYGVVPPSIEQAILDHFPQLAVAVVQSWEPVWKIYLWCSMRCDEAARILPLSKVLRVVPVVTDDESRGLAETMQKRMLDRVGRVRDYANATEIGDGVVDALEEVGGVKLRPGLFSVPGEEGIARGESVLNYLAELGDSDSGMYDLYKEERGGSEPGLVLPVLTDQMTDLATRIDELDVASIGVGALRTLWFETRHFAERLRRNQALLGEHLPSLANDLEAAQEMLTDKAATKKTAGGKAVVLEPTPSSRERDRLALALRQIALAAHKAKPDVTALKDANVMLNQAQGAVRELRLRLLVRRLRRLVDAACYALEAHPRKRPKQGAPQSQKGRTAPGRTYETAKLFAAAVREAVAHVEERVAD